MPGDRTCPRCDTKAREDARFCRACGAALTVRCAGCGATLAHGQSYCTGCGSPVSEAPSAARRPMVYAFNARLRAFIVPAGLFAFGAGLAVVGAVMALGSDGEEPHRLSTAMAESGVFDGFNEPPDDGDGAPRGRPSPTVDDDDLIDSGLDTVATATSVPGAGDGPTPAGGFPAGFATPQAAMGAAFGYEAATPIVNCNRPVRPDEPCFDTVTFESMTEDGDLIYLFRPVMGEWHWVLIDELPDGSFAFLDSVPLGPDDDLVPPF